MNMVVVARRGDLTVLGVAADLGGAGETVRRSISQADIDEGIKDEMTTSKQFELVRLRPEKSRLEMEKEILRCAAVCCASSTLPK